jgi:hypothetical protein
MEEKDLELAQKDIEEALSAIEFLEKSLEEKPTPKSLIKEKFLFLSEKIDNLEETLKSNGIL